MGDLLCLLTDKNAVIEHQGEVIEGLFIRIELQKSNFNHIFAVPYWELTYCENSSVGRARPCQGRGRGFESRFPLVLLPPPEMGVVFLWFFWNTNFTEDTDLKSGCR